tara:strand:+ start:1158 stop:1823 length:666 start_codon:yes stop_codon:yes gene_type:complete
MVENKSVEKPKRQRTQKQIDAFEKARAKRSENLANKKKPPELTKEEKKEIKDYNKGFNVKTDKAPKIVEKDNAKVVSKEQYNPFTEANKKNSIIEPPKKKKELEVQYIDAPKPKRQYNKKPVIAPPPTIQEETDEELEDFSEWLDAPDTDEEEVKPIPKKSPPKKKTTKPAKIIYESDSTSDDDEPTVIIKKKPKNKSQPNEKQDYTSNLSLRDKLRLNGF